jgi:hypothetical protein
MVPDYPFVVPTIVGSVEIVTTESGRDRVSSGDDGVLEFMPAGRSPLRGGTVGLFTQAGTGARTGESR